MKLAYVLLCSSTYFFQSNAQISLGTAASFAVLGASSITSTGPSVLNGNVGVFPLTSIIIAPPGVVTGTTYSAGAIAGQAQTDAQAAYAALAGQTVTQILSGTDLGGLTLVAGVYKFATSAGLTGTLTLNGGGRTDGIFVFQIGSTLTTAVASAVVLTGGAQACNVYWQVGSSATLGTGTQFLGNILADQSITLQTNANNNGGLFALHAAVTLDSNGVNVAVCAVISSSSSRPASTTISNGGSRTTITITSIPSRVSTASSVRSSNIVNTGPAITNPGATAGSGSLPGGGGPTTVIVTNPGGEIMTVVVSNPGGGTAGGTAGGTGGGVAPIGIVGAGPVASILPVAPPIGIPGVSAGAGNSSPIKSPSELAALIQGAPGQFANQLMSSIAAGSNSAALISSIIASAFAAASLAPLQSENEIISALNAALNAPAALQNGLISSIIESAFAPASIALTTFLVNVTSVPSTLYTYEQTFTLNKLGTTTIICPISAPVSLVTLTVECTSVPTTLTTYNQTFTILETGMTTITCPLKTTTTCTNTAIIAAAAKTIGFPKATSSCTTTGYILTSPTGLTFTGKSAGPSSYSVAAIFFSSSVIISFLLF